MADRSSDYDPYISREDGLYIQDKDGKEYHISSNPDAEGDDGTGRDSDGGAD